jgi:hypothetical protein
MPFCRSRCPRRRCRRRGAAWCARTARRSTGSSSRRRSGPSSSGGGRREEEAQQQSRSSDQTSMQRRAPRAAGTGTTRQRPATCTWPRTSAALTLRGCRAASSWGCSSTRGGRRTRRRRRRRAAQLAAEEQGRQQQRERRPLQRPSPSRRRGSGSRGGWVPCPSRSSAPAASCLCGRASSCWQVRGRPAAAGCLLPRARSVDASPGSGPRAPPLPPPPPPSPCSPLALPPHTLRAPVVVGQLYAWGYAYVENLTWVWKRPNNEIAAAPAPYAASSHLTLLIFRREGAAAGPRRRRPGTERTGRAELGPRAARACSAAPQLLPRLPPPLCPGEGRDIELRHQRSPDVVFDCVVPAPGGQRRRTLGANRRRVIAVSATSLVTTLPTRRAARPHPQPRPRPRPQVASGACPRRCTRHWRRCCPRGGAASWSSGRPRPRSTRALAGPTWRRPRRAPSKPPTAARRPQISARHAVPLLSPVKLELEGPMRPIALNLKKRFESITRAKSKRAFAGMGAGRCAARGGGLGGARAAARRAQERRAAPTWERWGRRRRAARGSSSTGAAVRGGGEKTAGARRAAPAAVAAAAWRRPRCSGGSGRGRACHRRRSRGRLCSDASSLPVHVLGERGAGAGHLPALPRQVVPPHVLPAVGHRAGAAAHLRGGRGGGGWGRLST